MIVVCGTGHRPNKLQGYHKSAWLGIYNLAYEYLKNNMIPDIKYVISGGAQGWDMALANAARVLNIPYVLAIPFEGQEKLWPKEGLYNQDFYNDIKEGACEVKIICKGGYAPYKMQKRNEWMVDNSDLVLALWNGSDGGTKNCIDYARKQNKQIINLWEFYEKRNKN